MSGPVRQDPHPLAAVSGFQDPHPLAGWVNQVGSARPGAQDLIHPRHKTVGVFPWIMTIAVLLSLSACTPSPRDTTLNGRTMGTTYSIRIAQASLAPRELREMQLDVDAALADLNRQMSTWIPDSEISRFNRAGVDEPVILSAGFAHVVRRALEIAAATGGAFDPTVGALVNLWGFGPDGPRRDPPSPGDIAAARKTTGWRHLSLTPGGRLSKAIPSLQLDLGAIAKGYGVDRIAALLRERGLEHFLVEIGGETLADGLNADGEPWRVGVLLPDNSGHLHSVIRLTGGRAVATSGDYRQFFLDADGRIQSHIIDPRTAAPADHAVASVSVLAPDCLTADALATALLVLGPEEGLPLLDHAFPGVEALFLVRRDNGEFDAIATPGFATALPYEPRPSR
jgi:FAD:protein FMN transferase